MRILIADDDFISLELLRNVLAAAGHEVETALDGEEALAKLHATGCRLVIADWEMPGLTGVELCKAVRTSDLPGYVYFILLTCHSAPEFIIEGLAGGADDFIAKPFNPGELTVRVRAGERILALETRDMTIFALAKLAESRDPETGEHLERMRRYSRLLASHLRNNPDFVDRINLEFVRMVYLTSPLHDIGKVGIPDSVLLKPARLTPDEFEIMKTHTTIGASTLEAAIEHFPSAQFLTMARDIALSHHERFDGTGYPRRLAGDHIPLAGRIVALADVYDALTSKRVYKDPIAHEDARQIILSESGSHFDPAVVQAFLSAEGDILAVQQAGNPNVDQAVFAAQES